LFGIRTNHLISEFFPHFHGKGRRRNVETVGTECISEPLQKAGSVETQALLEKKKSFMKVLLVSELNTLHRKWKVKQVA